MHTTQRYSAHKKREPCHVQQQRSDPSTGAKGNKPVAETNTVRFHADEMSEVIAHRSGEWSGHCQGLEEGDGASQG